MRGLFIFPILPSPSFILCDIMSLSKRAKRIKKEREDCNPEHKCLKCGEPVSQHHFFCNDCYGPGLMYSSHIRNKFKTYIATNDLTEDAVRNIGLNYLNPIYLQEYIDNNIRKNPKIGIGVVNQSTQVLPVFINN